MPRIYPLSLGYQKIVQRAQASSSIGNRFCRGWVHLYPLVTTLSLKAPEGELTSKIKYNSEYDQPRNCDNFDGAYNYG